MKRRYIRRTALLLGIVSLAICLLTSVAVFNGNIDLFDFKRIFLLASVAWFAAVTILGQR
jgi:hypothetical protein